MLQQQGLSGDGTYPTWAEQLREGDQHVDGEDEPLAHEANGTLTVSARKTARCGQIASHYEFATHTCVDTDTTMLVVDDEMTSGIRRDAGRLRARHTLPPPDFEEALSPTRLTSARRDPAVIYRRSANILNHGF